MKKLTDKNIRFCEEYIVANYNGTEAYHQAYTNPNKNTCAVEAHRLLNEVMIQNKIKEIEGDYRILGHSMGIDKKFILKLLKDQFQATKPVKDGGETKDNIAINNAINTWAKLTGEFAAEKQEIITTDISGLDRDPTEMTPEERAKLEKSILEEL